MSRLRSALPWLLVLAVLGALAGMIALFGVIVPGWRRRRDGR